MSLVRKRKISWANRETSLSKSYFIWANNEIWNVAFKLQFNTCVSHRFKWFTCQHEDGKSIKSNFDLFRLNYIISTEPDATISRDLVQTGVTTLKMHSWSPMFRRASDYNIILQPFSIASSKTENICFKKHFLKSVTMTDYYSWRVSWIVVQKCEFLKFREYSSASNFIKGLT